MRASGREWWVRLWGIAALAHVVGNPRVGQLWPDPTALGVSTVLVGGSAMALLLVPRSRAALGLHSAFVLVSVWFEAPFIGNHWLLTGFVSAALLVALTAEDWWTRFAPTGRWMLLVFYSFAAFSKLNEGFFDPSVSCGVVYANQMLDAVGLPLVPSEGPMAWAVILGTAAIEVSVPVLLAIPRTRRIGVAVGSVFHYLISLDLGQHFFDFTAVLLALFALVALNDRREPGETARGPWAIGAAVAAVFVLASLGPLSSLTLWILRSGVFVVWIPLGAWITVRLIRMPALDVRMRLGHPVAVGLVVLVVLNGVAPYAELKTATGWNMYANLVTADGTTNHLIVPRTMPLTDAQENPVEIVASTDPGLEEYVGSGWHLPERNLRRYLGDRPKVEVTFVQEGIVITTTGVEFGEKPNPVVSRIQFFRALDESDPPRCQLTWLAAG